MFRKAKMAPSKQGPLDNISKATTGWFKRRPKWLRIVVVVALILAAPTIILGAIALLRKAFAKGASAARGAAKRFRRPDDSPATTQRPVTGTARDPMSPAKPKAMV